MTSSNCLPKSGREPVLTDDQQHACERLLALALTRASTTETMLPSNVLSRWSVPLLIGPAGGGKAFVCTEVARQWNGKPCRRWEVSSWVTRSSRSYPATLDQIQMFATSNPAGGIVYLAGIDALGIEMGHNASYYLAVTAEIVQLLDGMAARRASLPGRDGVAVPASNTLMIVGGCFSALWGDPSIGTTGQEDWRLADTDALDGAEAVVQWMQEHSRLPTDILRRLSSEPLILQPMGREQAERIAVRLRDSLPPSLDGLSTEDFVAALRGANGWRGVAALVERTWIDCQQGLLERTTEAPVPKLIVLPPEPTEAESFTAPPPMRLGELLGIPSNRSMLLGEARRLGLCTNSDFQRLAIARGYILPDEDLTGTTNIERVGRGIFSDNALMAALLSPCLTWDEQVICRGARMLAVLLATIGDPSIFLHEIRRARGALIVRHVAIIGFELHPQLRCWRDMLSNLPSTVDEPVFEPGVIPDAAIRRILSAPLS